MHTPTTAVDQPTLSALAVDASRCPLCSQPNQCAMAQARQTGQPECGPCWCTQAIFSADLLARVPGQAHGQACICAQCAR